MFAVRATASLSIFRRAALAGGLLLLAFAALAPTAGAGEQLPPTTPVLVYHSTDPDGAAPQASLPPGCEAVGGGGAQTIIDFEGFSNLELVSDLGDVVLSSVTGDGVQVWANGLAGTLPQSGVKAIIPVLGGSATSSGIPKPDLVLTFDNPQNAVGIWGGDAGGDTDPFTMAAYDAKIGGNQIDFASAPVDFSGTPPVFLEVNGPGILRVEVVASSLLSFDDLTFDGGGGDLACALTGSENDVIELWVDGGSGNGFGNLCRLGPLGNNGDHVCGADLLLEITEGSGRFTEIDVLDGTLVHSPDCVESDGEDCFLPSEPGTTELRMNFRRGEGDPPLGPRLIANVHLDTSSSSVENPTIVKLRNFIAAGAALQERPLATLASGEGDAEILAKGPIPVPEPGRLVMLVSGLAGLWALHRRRQRRRAP